MLIKLSAWSLAHGKMDFSNSYLLWGPGFPLELEKTIDLTPEFTITNTGVLIAHTCTSHMYTHHVQCTHLHMCIAHGHIHYTHIVCVRTHHICAYTSDTHAHTGHTQTPTDLHAISRGSHSSIARWRAPFKHKIPSSSENLQGYENKLPSLHLLSSSLPRIISENPA